MKKSWLIILLLVSAIDVYLFAAIFLPPKPPGNGKQAVSLIVDHFDLEPYLEEEEPSDEISGSPEETPASQSDLPVTAGFDMPDEIFVPDIWLDEIEDFRSKVESTAQQR